MAEELIGLCRIDLFISLVLILFYIWLKLGQRIYDDIVWQSYLEFQDHKPPAFEEFSEMTMNIILFVYALIFYMLYLIKDYLGAKNEERTQQHREYMELFKLETEFMKQLREHGVKLDG